MADENYPDVEKFMSDPKFQKDREFFRALNHRFFVDAMKEAETQQSPREGNFFDRLFFSLFKSAPEDVNPFDRIFGRKK
jgi:hypothetical protein